MDKDSSLAKQIQLWRILYITVLTIFSIWFLYAGGSREPLKELFRFFTRTEIVERELSFESWRLIIGFALISFWIMPAGSFISQLIFKNLARSNLDTESLGGSVSSMVGNLVVLAVIEEGFFRLIPLGIIFPLLGGKLFLWIIIIASNLIFALLHFINLKEGNKVAVVMLFQFPTGLIYCYVFLSLGFFACATTYLIFDALIVISMYVEEKIISKGQPIRPKAAE